MTETRLAPRPMLLFWLTAVIVCFGLFWSVVCFIDLLLHPLNTTSFLHFPLLNWLSGFLAGPLTIGIGFLILRRQPRNIVGLFMILIGESTLANTLRADIDSTVVLAINSFYGGSIWAALFLLVPYFPDGRMFPPRYARIMHGIAVYFLDFSWLVILGSPTLFVSNGTNVVNPANPFFVPALKPIISAIQSVGGLSMFALIGLGLWSLIRRYRDGDQHLRAQVRWLIANMMLFAVFAVVGFTFNLYTYDTPFSTLFSLVFYIWLPFFPIIGIAYAILRHKLYDIDIIIRRTLIYSILSAILAGVYFGTVILVQQVFQSATGEVPDAAIVVSTLLIAALFNPLRQGIQAQIDRRFYRRKYDVEQTLAQFQQNLRDEVDMPTLQRNLISVVNETMQPSSIRLWMKDGASSNTQKAKTP